MSGAPLVVLGDLLLDRDVEGSVERLSPDAPVPVLDQREERARPGGAGLAALLAAGDGRTVTLVSAVAADAGGERLRGLLRGAGVELVELELEGPTPEKIRLRADGRPLMRLDRGGGGAVRARADGAAAIDSAAAVLVSDYGRGVAAHPAVRAALARVAERVPVVWDPHPRGPAPVAGVTVATPNEAEVRRAQREPEGPDLARASERALALRARWEAGALCMTRGAAGALLVRPGRPPLALPAPRLDSGDPCGAGDRFAARLAVGLAAGVPLEEAAADAVRCATAFVAAGGAGVVGRSQPQEPGGQPDGFALARRVREAGGVVAATGGCFDLLHAGHVRTLEAARRLGDCLVVCLNSDASVARLKGPDRPLVPQEDRADVLAALGCVDAVVVFDEDTPEAVLESLRPHVWVKGGDYGDTELPEERALRRWGGRAVLVPFVEGRSTTRLIEEAACRV